jgi:hypothetical protein
MAMATAAGAPVAAAAAPVKKAPKQRPEPNSDFYQLVDVLTAEESAIVKKVRTYLENKVQPSINRYWSNDAFPFELMPSFKELQLGGLGWGPGLRWGIMGQFLPNHLGDGQGDMEHFLIAGDHAEIGLRSIDDLAAERDEVLLGPLALHANAAVAEKVLPSMQS